MGELSVRRNRGFAVPQYQRTEKTEKQTGSNQVRRPDSRAAATVSETLRQLMTRVSQAERYVREGRRTLQTGEAALAEVQDSLEQMEGLAREAAGDGPVDRSALQQSLELLRGEIERIAQNGIDAGLFQDGGVDGPDSLVDAVLEGLAARQEGTQSLPAWLLQGVAGEAPDKAALLSAVGLDETATGPELLAALGRLPLEESPAAGYLAALYLGAVISGGAASGTADPEQAAEGLQRLLEMVAQGVSPDQAVELLTGGMFSGMADFQAQFAGGIAPGMEPFLMDLLFSGETVFPMPDFWILLDGGGGDIGMLMDLLAALDGSEAGAAQMQAGAAAQDSAAPPEGAALQAAAQEAERTPQLGTAELGTVQAVGRDVSGAALDPETGTLTVDGADDIILRGLGQEAPAVRLASSGTVTLQQVNIPLLNVESAQAMVQSAGETVLAQVHLGEGAVLTIDGGGFVRIGQVLSGASGALRLTGGAVELAGNGAGAQAVPVVVDGPVSLLAADGTAVRSAQGEPLTPFDIVWKTLLPEWSSLTALAIDGRQGRQALTQNDPVRLWLLKGDSSQGYPAHGIVLRGRDRAGQLRTRYVCVRWDQRTGVFQEVSMYPNPFTVTGGEPEQDWRYEEESQTLRILSGQAVTIAGGTGTDANQTPFSGRIALAGGIGRVELTLDNVECRVASGRAFDLGRENDVTLLLQRGTHNVFESGPGYAGISLGVNTALRIDKVKGARGDPDGTLTVSGGSGGAGIGRDSGGGRGQTGPILIRGGMVNAAGTGGGAGIGGALGAAAGDIRIQGGTVTAQADCCAAAIGAGIQGGCGDISITGSARVAKAQGGGPDGDIGGCLFGNCGRVQVAAGTDIGGAKLWTRKGFSIQMGETSLTLPRFRVSAQALRLDTLNLSNREAARSALTVLAADRRWVARLQGAYGAMYGQLGQSASSMYSVQRYAGTVRDTSEASSLACDIREVLRQSPKAIFLRQRGMEDVGYLLRG